MQTSSLNMQGINIREKCLIYHLIKVVLLFATEDDVIDVGMEHVSLIVEILEDMINEF